MTETRQLASQIVSDLANGLSVLLTGLPGTGRSYLARLVAQDLKRRHANVVMLHGNSLLGDRPLAALNLSDPHSERANKEREGAGTPLVTYAASRLEALIDPPKSIIIIDDAEEIDSLTAGLIANMRSRRKVPLLVIAVSEPDAGDVVDRLVGAAQPGVAIKLTGISFEGIMHMVSRLLKGPVTAEALSRIATLSGGLPGLIESIVSLASRDGRLAKRDGAWTVTGPLWDSGLRFSLLPLLRGLRQEDIDFLAQVAEGRTVDTSNTEQIRRLTQYGVLHYDRVSPDGCVFPPALAELLRYDDGAARPAPGQATVSTIDLGRWPTSLSAPEATAIVDRIRTHWDAELARMWREWHEDRLPRTAVPLLIAIFSTGAETDQIEAVIGKTALNGDDPDALMEFRVLTAIYRAAWQHDLEGALSDLNQLRESLPNLNPRVTGWICHLVLICQQMPNSNILGVLGCDSQDCDILAAARIEALVSQGRIQDAAEQLAHLAPDHDSARIIRQTLEALVLVLGDDVSAGVELAVKQLWDALMDLDVLSVSGHAYVAVLGMSILGRFDELRSIVEIMYRLGDANVFQNHYKTGLFMLGYFVADWQGGQEYARNLARQAESLGITVGPFPGMLANYYGDWTDDQPWNWVNDLLDRGYLTSAVFLAVPTAEANPTAAHAARVIRQGRDSQSPVLRALSRYVSAIVSGDVAQFPSIVTRLRDTCGSLDVTRANVTWALMLRERGDLTGWLEKATDAWTESTAISGRCDGLFTRLVEAVNLTDRESEVAYLASKGLSSQEIADKAGIALRTIEAHLHSVYRKTGVNNRDQLRQIVNTWLSLPADNWDKADQHHHSAEMR